MLPRGNGAPASEREARACAIAARSRLRCSSPGRSRSGICWGGICRGRTELPFGTVYRRSSSFSKTLRADRLSSRSPIPDLVCDRDDEPRSCPTCLRYLGCPKQRRGGADLSRERKLPAPCARLGRKIGRRRVSNRVGRRACTQFAQLAPRNQLLSGHRLTRRSTRRYSPGRLRRDVVLGSRHPHARDQGPALCGAGLSPHWKRDGLRGSGGFDHDALQSGLRRLLRWRQRFTRWSHLRCRNRAARQDALGASSSFASLEMTSYSRSPAGSHALSRTRRMRKAFPICTSTVFTEIPSRIAISAYLRPSNRLSSKI